MKFYTLDDSVMFLLTKVDDAHYHYHAQFASPTYAPYVVPPQSSSNQKASVRTSTSLSALSALSVTDSQTAAIATAPVPTLPRVNSAISRVWERTAPVETAGTEHFTVPATTPAGSPRMAMPPPHKRASSDTVKL